MRPPRRRGPRKLSILDMSLAASACARNGGLSAGPRTRPINSIPAQSPATASIVASGALGEVSTVMP